MLLWGRRYSAGRRLSSLKLSFTVNYIGFSVLKSDVPNHDNVAFLTEIKQGGPLRWLSVWKHDNLNLILGSTFLMEGTVSCRLYSAFHKVLWHAPTLSHTETFLYTQICDIPFTCTHGDTLLQKYTIQYMSKCKII